MSDQVVKNLPATAACPFDYKVPPSVEWMLQSIIATFDGSGAGGDFLPGVEIVGPGGVTTGIFVDPNVKIAMGSSGTVTFGPFLAGANGANTTGSIHFGDNDGSYLSVATHDHDGMGRSFLFEIDGGTGVNKFNVENNSASGSGIVLENNGDASASGVSGITINNNAPVGGGQFGILIENDGGGGMGIFEDAGDMQVAAVGTLQLEGDQLIKMLLGVGGLQLVGLTSTNPGGSGNVWNNGGVLNIT